MGRDFNFAGVRKLALALSLFLQAHRQKKAPLIVLNFDQSCLADRYAGEMAKIFSRQGLPVLISERYAPAGAMARAIIDNRGSAGITLAACGRLEKRVLLYQHSGAPAMPSWRLMVENEAGHLPPGLDIKPCYPAREMIREKDLTAPYLSYLQSRVDFSLLRRVKPRIVLDLNSGSARDCLDGILRENGLEPIMTPPKIEKKTGSEKSSFNAADCRALAGMVVENKADLGAAISADGRCFRFFEQNGKPAAGRYLISALVSYLLETKNNPGPLVKSANSSLLIDAVAASFSLPVYESAPGEKFLADLAAAKKAAFAVDEVESMVMGDDSPCADAILFALFVLQMTSAAGKSLGEILRHTKRRFGKTLQARLVLRPGQRGIELYQEIVSGRMPAKIPGNPKKVKLLGGIKACFPEGWFFLRRNFESGVFTLRVEAFGAGERARLVTLGRSVLG